MSDRSVRCFGGFGVCENMCEAKYQLYRHCVKTKKMIKEKVFDDDSLVRKHAGVNVVDDNGYTPLHHACLQGHKEIVRLLLAAYASPSVPDKKGATPLHLAAWKGDVHIVCMLLNHNPPVDVNQKTHDNETALLMAAQFGHNDVVAELMNHGADVSIRSVKDESALDLAAHYGRLETVRHLIKAHPSLVHPYQFPKWKLRKFSTTPLHRASKNGRHEVVLELLKAGIDPNIRTDSGTPLHEAACFGKASVVRILLEHGADLFAVDGKEKTVEELLAVYSKEATRRVRIAIRDHKNKMRNNYESEEDVPPFPVRPEYSPNFPPPSSGKAQETQMRNNLSDTRITPSSSFLIKNPQQSFVKKLASKCLGLKAKFNSAPNISNTTGLESGAEIKLKQSDQSKLNTNALHIGNSKFFKILSKKEDSGDIDCTDEFDTISLDRLGTLNRDSTINRSNRSCPGFKTSLPNISENNELSDSRESIHENQTEGEENIDERKANITVEAVNLETKYGIFEPRKKDSRISASCEAAPLESEILVNECYEPYEFSNIKPLTNSIPLDSKNSTLSPKPPPRFLHSKKSASDHAIYENIPIEKTNSVRPTPAVRTHIPSHTQANDVEKKSVYENFRLLDKKPEPLKRSFVPLDQNTNQSISSSSSSNSSRTSSFSSDSMIDESNLEDILLSEKSRSFRHGKKLSQTNSSKSTINRSQSSESNFTDITGTSAIENVDCSDIDKKSMYLSMTGTLPTNKSNKPKKKVLFRHKTFTNIEVDRNSFNIRGFTSKSNSIFKETLANYHIRGTGHCIYQAPTVEEFIYIFNKESLYTDTAPFTKVSNDKNRYSDFETAICFCKPKPPKHHNSAEDLLDISIQEEGAKILIDIKDLKDKIEIRSSSFRCYCDTGTCALHARKRETSVDFVVKFSAINKSISTPNITLLPSPTATTQKCGLLKNKSASNLEEPYAVVNIDDIVNKDNRNSSKLDGLDNSIYVQMSPHSSLSSSDRPYSIKDIAEVISMGTNSRSDTNPSSVSGIPLCKSISSEHSGHWSLQSCNSNLTVVSDASFKTCLEESSDDGSDGTLHSDGESSDAETVKSDVSTTKRPWVHSSSFRFDNRNSKNSNTIEEETSKSESKFESGISVLDSESSSTECEGDSDVPGVDLDVSLDASLERVSGMVGGVRSGSRRRWEEAEGASEGDALSISSAASSCAPMHLAHHHEYSKVSPTPPKKPPRRNLSVSPTHVNSPSSGYSYELRTHARSQDDLDDLQGAKHYLKHGRSVDQYVDGKLSYSEYEENHNSPRAVPVPNPRPSLKNRTQPVAITAMYENVVIKEQNPRRKLRRNHLGQYENFEARMADKRVRKYSNQERSSLESLLDDQSMNSPSEYEKYFDEARTEIPLSPSHYEQPPTPDHPPPSAKQAENSIHERIRPLSQLIMEVVEEIRIRKKSQGDVMNS